MFHDLYRIGNKFGKGLAFGISAAGDHKVCAARKAGFAKACSRIVKYNKAHLAHPFFGVRTRARNKAFVISVDRDGRHLGASGQFFEQNIVAVTVQLFCRIIGQVSTEEQVVGLNGIDLRNKAAKLFCVEERVHVDVAKEDGSKVFGVLARQIDGKQVRFVFVVMLHAVANKHERNGTRNSKQITAHAAHLAVAQVVRLGKVVTDSVKCPGNVKN